MTSACARLRVSTRPRSTRSASSRRFVAILGPAEAEEDELGRAQAAALVEPQGVGVSGHHRHLQIGHVPRGELSVHGVEEGAPDARAALRGSTESDTTSPHRRPTGHVSSGPACMCRNA